MIETRSPVEIRYSSKVVSVSFPKRTIEIIVVPYDEPTLVEHKGRTVSESVAPGAFDGIETRPQRVRVNYHHQDHELRHQLGNAQTFYPSREEGLVSVVKIRKNEYGDMALEAADDGDLGASGGFAVMDGGESWPSRQTRRLTRLFLDHIALTPTPAYTGARVLAVRQADPVLPEVERPATPMLKALELQFALEEEARINARYSRR